MIELQASSDAKTNSAAIQAAIDTLAADDFIMLQPGMKYPYAQTHTLRSGTRIYGGGSGLDRAQLIAPVGFTDPAFQNAAYTAGAADRVDSGIGLHGLILTGGGKKGVLNPKANPLILLEGVNDCDLSNLFLEDSPGDGLYVAGHKKGANAFQVSTKLRLTSVIVHGADRNGFAFISVGDSLMNDCEAHITVNALLDFETNQQADSIHGVTVIGFIGTTENGLGVSWGTHQDDSQLTPSEATWNQVSNITFYACDVTSKLSAYNACQSATNVSLTACKGLSTDANGANFHVMAINPNSKQRQYALDRCDFSAPKGEALSLASGENFTANDTFLHDSQYGFRSRNTSGTYRGLTYANNAVKDASVDKYMVAAAN